MRSLVSTISKKRHILRCAISILNFLSICIVKYSFSEVRLHCREYKIMAGEKSEKATNLKYTIQPFLRQSFDVISPMQIIARPLF